MLTFVTSTLELLYVCHLTVMCTQQVEWIDTPTWWRAYTWDNVPSVWASEVSLDRSPVASHFQFNYMAGLRNTLISSTWLIVVKVAGGPHDDTASGHDVYGETVNYTTHLWYLASKDLYFSVGLHENQSHLINCSNSLCEAWSCEA